MSHKSLTKFGYILLKKNLTSDETTLIKHELTHNPILFECYKRLGKSTKFTSYVETDKRFIVPKYWGIKTFGNPIEVTMPSGIDINLTTTIHIKPHQIQSYKACENLFIQPQQNQLQNLGGSGGVLTLPCGYGKTIIAINLIVKLHKKTLIIVNKENLLNQWIERIKQFTNARVGKIQGKTIDVENKDIVLGMLQSLCSHKYEEQVFEDFGMLIVDETHHIACKHFSKALQTRTYLYTLGLSATPIRKDGLSGVIYNYLGDLFYRQRREGVNTVYVKQLILNSTNQAYNEIVSQDGTKNTVAMISNISTYEDRNSLIIEILRYLLTTTTRKILVLGLRREQLETLYRMLEDAQIRRHIITGSDVSKSQLGTFGLYYGNQGLSKKNHKALLETSAKCDVILGTISIAGEALDIPALNTLLLISPSTDVEQQTGRILRDFQKEYNPLIIDIVDNFANFRKHGISRLKYYKGEDYICDAKSFFLPSRGAITPRFIAHELIPYLSVLHTQNEDLKTKNVLKDKDKIHAKTTAGLICDIEKTCIL